MLYILSGDNYELTNKLLNELNDSNIRVIKKIDLNKYRNILSKVIAKIAFLLNIRLPFVFSKKTSDLLHTIKTRDTVLLWDIMSPPLVFSIKKHIKSKNISLWVWNTIGNDEKKIGMIKKIVNHIYTFDKDDARKYGIILKNQLCYDYKRYSMEKSKFQSDIYFVGVDKGRSELLMELYDFFTENGLCCDFHLIPDALTSKKISKKLLSEPVSFLENIEHIINTNCILELVKEGQTGLSMRALEAVCAEKKLITNNKDIVNYDFYNKEYIYILEQDYKKNILSFIDSCNEINYKGIRNNYLIEDWIKEFE